MKICKHQLFCYLLCIFFIYLMIAIINLCCSLLRHLVSLSFLLLCQVWKEEFIWYLLSRRGGVHHCYGQEAGSGQASRLEQQPEHQRKSKSKLGVVQPFELTKCVPSEALQCVLTSLNGTTSRGVKYSNAWDFRGQFSETTTTVKNEYTLRSVGTLSLHTCWVKELRSTKPSSSSSMMASSNCINVMN